LILIGLWLHRNTSERNCHAARRRGDQPKLAGSDRKYLLIADSPPAGSADWRRPGLSRATEEPELRHMRSFSQLPIRAARRAGAVLFRAQSAVSRSVKAEREPASNCSSVAQGSAADQYGRALLVRARVHAVQRA
jgi:hypothetical protein